MKKQYIEGIPLHSLASSGLTKAPSSPRKHYRTLFLSDMHLGSKTCQAEYLFSFLNAHSCDTLYLVGDILDGWRLQTKVYWPKSHGKVARRLLEMSKSGTRIVFVTGNHDEFLRQYSNRTYGNIELVDEATHVTPDGKKWLLLHGDQFDDAKNNATWLSGLGAHVYDEIVDATVAHNLTRNRLGIKSISVPSVMKTRMKHTHINHYENWISQHAKDRGFDGAVCGHIHHPRNIQLNNVNYLNCGDWVESCSALAENYTGDVEVIRWKERLEEREESVDILDDGKSLDGLSLLAEFSELTAEAIA